MPALVILFIVVPIVELWAIIEIGGLIGVLPTLVLLLAMSLLGAALLRQQGRGAWRRFNEALSRRRFPGREVADGLMITIGGVLLLTPGFITDGLGLLLLLPPTRAFARRLLRSYVGRRFVVVGMGGMRGGPGPGPGPGPRPEPGADAGASPPRRDYDYDSTAEEVDEDDRRLPGS